MGAQVVEGLDVHDALDEHANRYDERDRREGKTLGNLANTRKELAIVAEITDANADSLLSVRGTLNVARQLLLVSESALDDASPSQRAG